MISAAATTPDLSAEALTEPVRRALGSNIAEVIDWTCAALRWSAIAPTTAGLFHVTGSADVGGKSRDWTLVLKVIRRPVEAVEDKSAPAYWRREADAFASGVLDDLDGIEAPACYGTDDRPDGVWLWLEHVAEVEERWGLARYVRAANDLGVFGGSYLDGRPLPHADWLTRGYLRWWVGRVSPVSTRVVSDPGTWDLPLVRLAFAASPAERVLELVHRAPRLLEALDALPPTVCHNDAWRRNLIAARAADGAERTVLIDWSYPGLGPPGADAGIMIVGTHFWLLADPAELPRFDREVFDAYVEGVATRTRADRTRIRLAYAATAALWGALTAPVWLPRWGDPARRAWLEAKFGRPLEDAVAPYGRALEFMLDLGDEAWALLPANT